LLASWRHKVRAVDCLTDCLKGSMATELKEMALQVTTDPDHKFELSLGLDDLEQALAICRSNPSETKWRTVGDRALQTWKVPLAEECYTEAGDLSALLLIHTSTGSMSGLESIAQKAQSAGAHNVAFASRLLLGQKSACVDILLDTDRAPEAAFFARTYAPSLADKAVASWKAQLAEQGKDKIAESLVMPSEGPEGFVEGWEELLERERVGATQQAQSTAHVNGYAASVPAYDDKPATPDVVVTRPDYMACTCSLAVTRADLTCSCSKRGARR
jgi:coatomer subunit beta'